ncbi:MAG: hypothetical protein AB7O77_06990 [Phycisphaerales bacterium]
MALARAASASAAPEPVDLDLALLSLRSAYTTGVTEEFVEVIVRRGVSAPLRESFIVRLDPGSGTKHPHTCRLELDLLTVYWTLSPAAPEGRPSLVAVHERNSACMYEHPVEGVLNVQKLADALLPLPVPQLALALDPDLQAAAGRPMRWLTPYTPSILWTSASKDPRRAPGDIIIDGTCEPVSVPGPGEPTIPSGKTSATFDESTGRLKRFTAEIDGGKIELELRIRPERSLDRHSWPVSTAGRARVAALADLAPPRADAANAATFPDIVFQDARSNPWVTTEAFLKKVAAGDPERLALLFVRETPDLPPDAHPPEPPPTNPAPPAVNQAFDNPAARSAAKLLATIQSTAPPPAPTAPAIPPFVTQVVLVMNQPDDHVRTKIALGRHEWGNDVVWCSTPAGSIDRFAPDARAAIVIIKRDRSMCGVIPLEPPGSADSLAMLERRIREALACAAKAPGGTPPADTPPPP